MAAITIVGCDMIPTNVKKKNQKIIRKKERKGEGGGERKTVQNNSICRVFC